MKTEELQDLHRRTWEFRAEMADVWPTPDPLDALRFSFCEIGEAMDAYMRTKGGYARNHAKEPDLYGELADCALMLFTALGPDCEIEHWTTFSPVRLEEIGYAIADVLTDYLAENERTVGWAQSRITGALHAIATYPGMNLAAELDKRLAKIKAKCRGRNR